MDTRTQDNLLCCKQRQYLHISTLNNCICCWVTEVPSITRKAYFLLIRILVLRIQNLYYYFNFWRTLRLNTPYILCVKFVTHYLKFRIVALPQNLSANNLQPTQYTCIFCIIGICRVSKILGNTSTFSALESAPFWEPNHTGRHRTNLIGRETWCWGSVPPGCCCT